MKTLYKYIFLLLSIFYSVSVVSQDYKIHLITFYDNVDNGIKEGCKVDKDNFEKTIEKVSDKLNVPLIVYNKENTFSFEKMLKIYPQMKVETNDVVVFMYSGHGFHSSNQDKKNKYPFLYFTQNDEQKYNLLKIHEGLLKKNARLTITFGDLCNIVQEGPKTNKFLLENKKIG